jgi:hypothetical protein
VSKLVRMSENLLRETGLPWRLEQGKNHHKVFICERMVSIVPRGVFRDQGRAWANFKAEIKRAVKEMQNADHPSQ